MTGTGGHPRPDQAPPGHPPASDDEPRVQRIDVS